jgi:hypothetical protein
MSQVIRKMRLRPHNYFPAFACLPM